MPVTYSSSEHLANSVLRCRTTASSMAFGPGVLPITPPPPCYLWGHPPWWHLFPSQTPATGLENQRIHPDLNTQESALAPPVYLLLK